MLYPTKPQRWIHELLRAVFAHYRALFFIFAIFFIYLLIIYPACPARGKKSDDSTCTSHRFFFCLRKMLPAQSVVACLKFCSFCKRHRRRIRSLLRAKREPERTAVPAGHESPSGAFKPQTGLRSKCRVFSAARSPLLSRRGRRRVAAPCVCFVPCAALASCRPLSQQLLPVSATGRGRRRCKLGAARP